jgi:hypothetical protein
MVFVRQLAHINHNWRLFIFQRAFSFITGMLSRYGDTPLYMSSFKVRNIPNSPTPYHPPVSLQGPTW